VPLKTYRGSAAAPLLAQAQTELGPEAVVIRTEMVDGAIELLAADAETAAAVGKLMGKTAPAAPRVTLSAAKGPSPDTAAPQPAPRRRDIIALVGPTGAGKTTSIAKLASSTRIWAGRRVGLIGLDTYRVGAVEQLAAYATTHDLPVETVYEPSDVQPALKRLTRCEVLLIDCPGRGPRNQRDADAVRDLLTHLAPHEIHLALPAGLQRQIAARLIEHHAARGMTHLLATKVDEVPDDWTLFELAAERRIPMRWLSDGQRVPQDLRSATPRLTAAQASLRSRSSLIGEGVA
jgi:flagellar biosynthesis protein FlhF